MADNGCDIVRRYNEAWLSRDLAGMAGFLGEHGLSVGDIAAWVSHPGGPKVIEAITAALGLADDALELHERLGHALALTTKAPA